MPNPDRRRDLLKIGTLTTAASALMPWASPPREIRCDGEPPRGATDGGLIADRALGGLEGRALATADDPDGPEPDQPVHRGPARQEGYSYFRERGEATPDEPIFHALEGLFQARMAGQVFLFRRAAWVKDAIAKLDRAVETGHPITRYCRGVALAEVPARFGRVLR